MKLWDGRGKGEKEGEPWDKCERVGWAGWLPPLVRERRRRRRRQGLRRACWTERSGKRMVGGVEKGAGRMREDNRGWRKRGRTKGAYRHRSSYPLVTPFILSVSVPPSRLKPSSNSYLVSER